MSRRTALQVTGERPGQRGHHRGRLIRDGIEEEGPVAVCRTAAR
ncbi:hypothetical protein [Streptomyces sp. NBC_00154]|nr:hypothetical protein [Streptomyces sp. NBC_00154]MCX5316480.1 hypothetical protein [Streptomyces sp. NBC_00154]